MSHLKASARYDLQHAATPRSEAPSPAVAVLHGFDLGERPLITIEHEIMPAESTVPLAFSQIGARVLVLFEHGEPTRPVVIGVMRSFSSPAAKPAALPVQVDDERLVLSAEREIVLTCGESSITLTRAGKIIIKGKSLLSRASGPNKIRGASVQIN